MKVGIIGCGIVGAYLAWKLAESNEVYLFEEKAKIGSKPCSGLISERLWDFVPRNEKVIMHAIGRCRISFPKKKVHLYFKPSMMIVDRNMLTRYVAWLAHKKGAKLFVGHKARKLFFNGGHKPQVSFDTPEGIKAFEFDRIIGCDGALSFVRREVGGKDPKFRLGIYTYKKQKSQKRTVETFPTKNGFSWSIPRGDSMEVGTIEVNGSAKGEFERIRKRYKLPKNTKKFSALIPNGLTTLDSKNVALCGDAAGLTKPWSGGGVIWGLTAADLLVKSFPNFRSYNRKVKRKFGPQLIIGRALRKTTNFAGTRMPWLLPSEIRFDSDWV
ncbi:MAG: hypothetical protein QXU82_00390 [Candidatus Aenigmatarchaeota archaeon]